MYNTFSGFKRFIEEMDPSPEKRREDAESSDDQASAGKEDYFAALGDEEGLEWGEIANAFQSEPWISSHFALGSPDKEVLYKLSPWKIVKGTLTPHGADIRLKQQKGGRSYLKGNRLNKSKYQDTKRYHLNRSELVKFLTTGWTPAAQQAGGGSQPM